MFAISCLMLLGSLMIAAAADGREFDPAYEAQVLINVSAPVEVRNSAKLELGAIRAHSGQRVIAADTRFDTLDSSDLAGRYPRLAKFTVEPGILDSLEFDWSGFDVLVDQAWTHPPSAGRPTVFHLARRVEAGEVVVLNLLWLPDAMDVDARDWRPVFETQEFAEPPSAALLYASEESSGVVSVLRRLDGRMVRAFATGGQPRGLAFDEFRQRVWVAVAGRDELQFIDVAGLGAMQRVPLTFGSDPTRVRISPDGQQVGVLAPGRDSLFLFSASSLQEIARVRVGQEPVGLASDPRTGLMYVSSEIAGRIDAVDPRTGRIVSTISDLHSPAELVVLRSGAVAVGQRSSRAILLIDPGTGQSRLSVDVCGAVDALVSVPRLGRLYALENTCSEIAILRAESGLELGRVRLGEPAGLMSVDARETEIFVPLPQSGLIMRVPLDRPSDHAVIDIGPGVWRVVAP